ncbi:MAG: ABC-F family ATP-binding cassette domain-containing protein [Cyanobacteria bacterium J06621_11]
MPQFGQPYLTADSLSYAVAEGKLLFEQVSASIFKGDRIALVGKNGTGKSTFLKILASYITPTTGSVSHSTTSTPTIVYVPQTSQLKENIGDNTVFDFLSATADAWWEIEQKLETVFNRTLDLSISMQDLSGGELMQLSLAIALWQSSDLLLLDEPTNHLDHIALTQLQRALAQFKGALVIVSHKPFFLDQVVDTVWELTPTGLQVYGGNYSRYREQKQLALDAKLRSHATARKELTRTKTSAQHEQKRAAASRRGGRQQSLKGGIPRIVAGGLKRRAEKVAGNAKAKHDAAVAEATKKVVETKVRSHKVTSIQLSARSHKRRNLIDIQGADLWVGEQQLLRKIDLNVESGDRIAISGPNGSGKSSLIKAILTSSPAIRLENGNQQIADMKTVYLDQQYALVDRQQTVLENMHRANPSIAYQLLRQQLGHFLFFNQTVHKQASVLSGGELARCAIAMITISELDLLILDEPTNNLDIETVDQIVDGLNQYTGALIVISHDLDFLSRINITHSFQLQKGTFSAEK